MRLFVLSRSHRHVGGSLMCSACRKWKHNTAKLAVGPEKDSVAFPTSVVDVCSRCARDLVRCASEGRKAER